MKISVIVGFRNREMSRLVYALDALSNQNFTDFELIFIDYGSDEAIAQQAETLVEEYSFARYYYSNTRGWFWNRAHALNTGVKIATGELMLFFDIDLIVEKEFLQKIALLDYDSKFYTFSCFYLPEQFNYEQSVLEIDGIHFKQDYVGLCAVSREMVNNINGFDEYFMVWGAEDDDFYTRLRQAGIAHIHQSATEFTVFHQWHPTHTPKIPTMWYLQMVHYLSKKRYNSKNSTHLWGKRIAAKERLLLSLVNNHQYDLDIRVSNHTGYLLFNELIDAIYNPAVQNIRFEYRQLPMKKGKSHWLSLIKSVSTKMDIYEISINDALLILQHVIGSCRPNLADYRLQENSSSIELIMVKVHAAN